MKLEHESMAPRATSAITQELTNVLRGFNQERIALGHSTRTQYGVEIARTHHPRVLEETLSDFTTNFVDVPEWLGFPLVSLSITESERTLAEQYFSRRRGVNREKLGIAEILHDDYFLLNSSGQSLKFYHLDVIEESYPEILLYSSSSFDAGKEQTLLLEREYRMRKTNASGFKEVQEYDYGVIAGVLTMIKHGEFIPR